MDLLYTLQNLRVPVLTEIFALLTYLGSETFLLLIGAVLYWNINKRRGLRMIISSLSAVSATTILKGVFAVPRPWLRDSRLSPVDAARGDAADYSFPSGHSTISAALYGTLSADSRQKKERILYALIPLLVAFTRLYLGVHTPLDVLCGLAVGGLFTGVSVLMRRRENDPRAMHFCAAAAALVSIAGLIGLKLSGISIADSEGFAVMKELSALCGVFLGICAGGMIEDKHIRFETEASRAGQVLKVLLGVALLVALKAGVKALLSAIWPGSPYTDLIRYFLMALFLIDVWPLTFPYFAGIGKNKK